MGWGVGASDSYPARLATKLAPGLHVLNLGVDGFGAIGATAKSRALADRFPPAHAVYLFSPNDLEDDLRAAAVARRRGVSHRVHEWFDAARRSSYLAGIPFALRYRMQFKAGAAPPTNGGRVSDSGADPRALLLPEPPALPAAPPDHPTFAAIRDYRNFLADRGVRLTVLVLSTQRESLMTYRFCREQGIEAHLFEVPPSMRIPDEGHFNTAGNETVASLVAGLIAAERHTAARDALATKDGGRNIAAR
jgi:hypothetical protein